MNKNNQNIKNNSENLKKVSIIIPCYNASKTLDRCLSSVVSQTYTNKEVLIINDGSTDNSLEILKKYCDKYDFIKVITKENNGVSSARNLGLKIATGDYIMFLDSDDNYTNKHAIEIMVKTLEEKNVDLVVCSFTHPVFKTFLRGGKYDLTKNKQKMKYFNDFFVFGMPWNKVYRREVLTENYNENMHFTEDELFNIANLPNFKSVYFINKVLYNYYCAPKETEETSLINTIQLKKDETARNGFFFKRYDGRNFRDPVIKAKFNKKLANEMIYGRYIYFAAHDVEFMKHLNAPKSAQYETIISVVTSPEFKEALTLCETKKRYLKSNDDAVLSESAIEFVDKANSPQVTNKNRISFILDAFYDAFYKTI